MRHPTDDRVWGVRVLEAKVAVIEAYSSAAAENLFDAVRVIPGIETKRGLALLELMLERLSFKELQAFDARAHEIARVPFEDLKRAYEVAAFMEGPTFLLLPPGALADIYRQIQACVQAEASPHGANTPAELAYDVLITKLIHLVYFVLEERGERRHRLRLVR